MAKIRVADLARRYGMPSKVMLELLSARGEFVKSASSSVESPVVAMLEQELGPLPDHKPRERPTLTDADLRKRHASRLPGPPRSFGALRPVGIPPSPRPTAQLPVAPVVTFDDLEKGLRGSPYSLPGQQREYIQETFLPLVGKLHVSAEVARRKISITGRRTLGRINRTTEIYQSNRIEGLGPDMATTDRLLNQFALDDQAKTVVAEEAIQRCINAEAKVRDVVGLGAAKMLAEHFCLDTERAISEADIRQLHLLIMVGQHDGGQYKVNLNWIDGSEHTPPNPTDSREQMHSLVEWLRASDLSPLWRAAVVHAWLTYIHPFRDGNGRIARLLANLILIREGLPPLIVRFDADRGRYIEALGASDVGGDILPLSRVFRKILLRAVRDLEDPDFARSLFEAEVERRYAPMYDRWLASANEFVRELASRLVLHQMRLEQIGGVGNDEFTRFRNGARLNVWVAKIHVAGKSQDILLHVAQPTTASRRFLESDEVFPSIFVSIRNPRALDARQYLPVGRDQFAYEFTPIPDTGLVLVRAHTDSQRLSTSEAAMTVANHVDRVARQLLTR
ncbi:translation initiation factor IF-2 N-terminal domain-containing protein [Aeromicrobium sp.]|uniref:translation initiation factor IF-2 N-terminal domain-containing protein n=1 Tax=Aeromicrobium sp. TaxID=1871063 RepID=UPI002FCB26F1